MLGKERTVGSGRWACIQFLDEKGNVEQSYALNKKGALVNKLKRQPRRLIDLQIFPGSSKRNEIHPEHKPPTNLELNTQASLPSKNFSPLNTTSLSTTTPAETTRSPSLQENLFDFHIDQFGTNSPIQHQIPDLCPIIELSEIPFPDTLDAIDWESVNSNSVMDIDF